MVLCALSRYYLCTAVEVVADEKGKKKSLPESW